jgi:hypothetical protein
MRVRRQLAAVGHLQANGKTAVGRHRIAFLGPRAALLAAGNSKPDRTSTDPSAENHPAECPRDLHTLSLRWRLDSAWVGNSAFYVGHRDTLVGEHCSRAWDSSGWGFYLPDSACERPSGGGIASPWTWRTGSTRGDQANWTIARARCGYPVNGGAGRRSRRHLHGLERGGCESPEQAPSISKRSETRLQRAL